MHTRILLVRDVSRGSWFCEVLWLRSFGAHQWLDFQVITQAYPPAVVAQETMGLTGRIAEVLNASSGPGSF